ncbi:hypothetical protein V6V89_08135 [Micromonospora sp. CPCC 206061]
MSTSGLGDYSYRRGWDEAIAELQNEALFPPDPSWDREEWKTVVKHLVRKVEFARDAIKPPPEG